MQARQIWVRWSTGVLLGAGALGAVLVVVPPARLRSPALETALAKRLGCPVHVDGAHWRLDPWPRVELRNAAAYPSGPGGWPIAVRARRVLLRGMPFLPGKPASSYQEVEFSGLELRSGSLGLGDAVVKLGRSRDGGLHLQGRALGSQGGSLEISGGLGGEGRAADPLRVYLAGLELLSGDPLGILPDPGWGKIRLSGVVTAEGDLTERQEIGLDLQGAAARQEAGGEWLQTTIRGRLIRQRGRFLAGRRVRVQAQVRDLGGSHELRAVHGGIDLWLDIAGDPNSGHLALDADLRNLRLRLANLLEKPAGTPASVRYEARWAREGRRVERGVLRLGKLRARLDRADSEHSTEWRLRSFSLPLSELRDYVPALRVLPDSCKGEVTVQARWVPERGVEGEAVFHGAGFMVGSRSVAVPFASLDLSSDRARLQVPRLTVADQLLSLEGSLEWVPSPGRYRVSAAARADRLDLEPLVRMAAPLWAPATARQDQGKPQSWAQIGRELVRMLRAHPDLLARLEVEPATLEVGRLTGLGVDTADTRFRLELSDRRVHLERGGRSSPDPPRRYALDLRAWLPKLIESP